MGREQKKACDLDVVVIGRETLTAFIARHGGVANTSNVAQRFGWDMRTAKRHLEAAATRGELEKMPAHEWPMGRVCSWRVPTGLQTTKETPR